MSLFGSDKDVRVTLGRNEPCHCGSKKKYKKCHLAKDEEAERKSLAKAEIKPLGEQTEEKKEGGNAASKPASPKKGGWLKNIFGGKGGGASFKPPSMQRKSGGGGA